MIIRTTIGCVLVCLSAYVLNGQRTIFSDFAQAPLELSPALAGAYSGSLRAGTAWREQYRTFITEPFVTNHLFVDAPLGKKLPENQWLGAGFSVTKQESGDLSLTGLNTALAFSYHRALDKRFRTVIGIGIQYGLLTTKVKAPEAARFEDQILGLVRQSSDKALLDNYNSTMGGLTSGVYLKKVFNKKITFLGGIAIDNIISSNLSTTANYDVPFRYTIHGEWIINTNSPFNVKPAFVLERYGKLSNASAFMVAEHIVNEKRDIRLGYRIGYRYQDAGIIGIRARNKLWSASLHYDMTVSSAQAYNGVNGAFEIGVSRIFVIYPRVKEKLIQLCPRY